METLLCDEDHEVWLMSPSTGHDHHHDQTNHCDANKTYTATKVTFFYVTKQDCENALKTCINKELNHMPQPGYIQHLNSNQFISTARFRTIQWLFQSQSRFSFSYGTIFNAANYFDCFISLNQCHEWKYCMFELLSVACLSVASKYGETAPPHFHDLQEGLDYSFKPGLIQRMEHTLLNAIGWCLNCVTPYSYVELMTSEMHISNTPLVLDKTTCLLTELLASSLLDYKLLAFRPCIIAFTRFKYILKDLLPSTCDAHIAYIATFIPQDQRESLIKCEKLLEEIVIERFDKLHANGLSFACYPSNPVTVLTKAEIFDQQVDSSLFKMPASLNRISLVKSFKKRMRDEN